MCMNLTGLQNDYNSILMDKTRCLMAEAKVDRKFWPECIMAAAYLSNRSLAGTAERWTPFEIFFKKKT